MRVNLDACNDGGVGPHVEAPRIRVKIDALNDVGTIADLRPVTRDYRARLLLEAPREGTSRELRSAVGFEKRNPLKSRHARRAPSSFLETLVCEKLTVLYGMNLV